MRPEARTIRVLFHACDVQKPISFPPVVLQNGGIEVMFVLTLAHSLSRPQLDSASDS